MNKSCERLVKVILELNTDEGVESSGLWALQEIARSAKKEAAQLLLATDVYPHCKLCNWATTCVKEDRENCDYTPRRRS